TARCVAGERGRDSRVGEHDAVGKTKRRAPEATHHQQLMRRPSPDFTTACATTKATTTSRTLLLAKPEKACAGVIVPVNTTAPTAIIEAVRSGKEPRSTH